MGLSFATALAANFQGQELVAKLDAQKAETANQNAQTAFKTQETADLQRKLQGQQQMAAWMQANTAAAAQPGADAEDFATKLQQGARVQAQAGNFDGAKTMGDMAKSEVDRAKSLRVEQAAKQQEYIEKSAQAAVQYVQNPSPENATALAGTATNAGVNPMTIPQPGTMEFMAWAKDRQTVAMSSKDHLKFMQDIYEKDRAFQEKQEYHQDQIANRQAALAQTAAFQQGTLGLRQESFELRKFMAENAIGAKDERAANAKEKSDFKETTQLVASAEKAAKPYFQDRGVTQSIKGLLSEGGSPAQDKQIQQLLTSLKSNGARATNLYYKDNKNFGDFAQKIEGFASQTFTGRYSDEQRKQIFEMVDGMERKVIDPALRNLETDAKEKAKLYKLPTDAVKLGGDFNRTVAPKSGATAKGGASVTGGVEEPNPQAAFKGPTAATPAGNTALPSGWTMK